MKTLYKAKWILPKGRMVIENGGFFVENSVISNVLRQEELENTDLSEYKIVDFGNSVITPGFINLHAHLQYTETGKKKSKRLINRIKRLFLYFRKILIFKGKQKSFISWIIDLLIEYICWTEEEKQKSLKKGLNEVLLSGTTCIAQLSGEEMYFEILNSSLFFETYADSEKNAEKSFEIFREKYEKLAKKCSKSTFLGISPHSVYNVHKELWKKISEYSRKNNVLIQTHFAESKEEIEWIKIGCSDIGMLHKFIGCSLLKPSTKGLNPVSYLKSLELPYENVILAHINQLNDRETEELSKLEVSIAHCPRSNMILHNRTIDIAKAIQAFPSAIGLGTDSLYSNYDLNILNEAKVLLNSGMDLFTVLDMLTINPAGILRIDHLTGSLEKGMDADFLVFKLEKGETYKNFINKESPDDVYISGIQTVKDKNLQLKY